MIHAELKFSNDEFTRERPGPYYFATHMDVKNFDAFVSELLRWVEKIRPPRAPHDAI